jgi:dimethlysulfoniopropionate lyase
MTSGPSLRTFIDRLVPLLPGDFAPAVGAIDTSTARPGQGVSDLPVLRFWPALCAGGGALMAPIAAMTEELRWVQNPNYVANPPDANFLTNYGYAVLAGPGGLVETDRLALGVLLLGPDTHYPSHRHPAIEIYIVAAGRAEWRKGEEPWRIEAPEAVIRHDSMMLHATRTLAEPLLAVYVWQGDLKTYARIITR